MKSIELQRQRADLHRATLAKVQEKKEKGEKYTPEELAETELSVRTLDELQEQIQLAQTEEKLELVGEQLKAPAPQAPNYVRQYGDKELSIREGSEVITNWYRRDNSPQARYLADRVGCDNLGQNLSIRTMSTVSGNDGGVFLGQQWSDTYERVLKYHCPIENYVKVKTTPDADPYHIPIVDSTSSLSSIPDVAENASTGTAFALKSISTNENVLYAFAKPIYIKVNMQSEMNSRYNIGEVVLGEGAERMGAAISKELCFNASSGGSTSAVAIAKGATDSTIRYNVSHAFDINTIDSVWFAMDSAYRDDPSTFWLMSDSMWKIICESRNEIGNNFVSGNLADGYVKRLHGKPVVISNDYVAPTTFAQTVLTLVCGNVYTYRKVGGLDILRDPYTGRTRGQVEYSMVAFYDGRFTGSATGAMNLITNTDASP